MTDQKQLELVKIPLSRLLKLEVPRFAERVIGIVASHNPKELQIKELYDLLVAEKPRISNLTDKFGPHPLTEELKKLRELRSLYISAIRLRLKIVIKESANGASKDLKTVRDNINHFLKNLKLSKNDEMFNQKITQFFEEVNANTELQCALSSLKFTSYLQGLEGAHNSIEKLLHEKLCSISDRPQEKAPELSKCVLTAIKNLFKQIDIAPYMRPDLKYEDLYNDLNQLLIDYRDIINKRVLHNKRKTEKIKNTKRSEATETIDTTEDSKPVRKTIQLKGDEMDIDELEPHPASEEKAITMWSKDLLLPVVNTGEA